MRKIITPLAATLLVFATASAALAAAPEKYRERVSGSEYDAYTSELCGFDVWLTYRVSFTFTGFSDGTGLETFDAQRFRTGPGGSINQVVHYTWTYPQAFEVVGDPESGSWQEIYRSILHGSRVWTTAQGGVILRDAGYYDATVIVTFTPDGETIEVTDEVARGQQPSMVSQEEANELLCETLG